MTSRHSQKPQQLGAIKNALTTTWQFYLLPLLMVFVFVPSPQSYASEKIYQVELYIFEQPSLGSTELWPKHASTSFLNTTEPMIRISPSRTTEIVQFQQLPETWVQSTDVLNTLKHSGKYRLLYQGAWQQPIEEKAKAMPIYLSAGNVIGNQPELEGTIRLHVSRYLHIEAHLILGEYQLAKQAPIETFGPEAVNTGFSEANTMPIDEFPVQSLQIFELKQSRRMRSGELHYLDHPRIGLLVQIHKVDA